MPTDSPDTPENEDEMPRIPVEELRELLDRHKQWLQNLSDLDNPTEEELAHPDRLSMIYAKMFSADLQGARLSYANLPGANLAGSVLFKADLTKANLDGAKLYDSVLITAKMSGAGLLDADLSRADLSSADLSGADLSGAVLQLANLSEANLTGAYLSGATLSGADLSGARLLTKSKFVLDDNFVLNTRFLPNSPDPYSVLRRKYTGPRFLLIILFTILALLPYLAKTGLWYTVGKGEKMLNHQQEVIESTLQTLEESGQISPEQREAIREQLREANPSTSSAYSSHSVISVLTGWSDGPAQFGLTLLLLAYIALRGLVTMKMTAIRDEEERSHHIPRKSDYFYLYRIHQGLTILLAISLSVGAYRIYGILTQTIYVPN